MPNYCDNALIVKFDKNNTEQVDYIKRMVASAEKGELLNFLRPIPENEKDNWYKWCVANWGTKWDIDYYSHDLEIQDGVLYMNFNTAWSPPIQAVQELNDKFKFELYYYETGIGFYGICDNKGDNGVEIKLAEKVNWADENEVEKAFKSMILAEGFNNEQAEQLLAMGLAGCFFNEDYVEEEEHNAIELLKECDK
jgi:hypothetical protein